MQNLGEYSPTKAEPGSGNKKVPKKKLLRTWQVKYLIYSTDFSNFLGNRDDLKINWILKQNLFFNTSLLLCYDTTSSFSKTQELLPEGTLLQKAEKDDQKFHSTFSCFTAG